MVDASAKACLSSALTHSLPQPTTALLGEGWRCSLASQKLHHHLEASTYDHAASNNLRNYLVRKGTLLPEAFALNNK
jgi:hypothetical protein